MYGIGKAIKNINFAPLGYTLLVVNEGTTLFETEYFEGGKLAYEQ